MDFVISDRAALERLRHDRVLRRTIKWITLDGSVPVPDARALESRINRDYFACGCEISVAAVLAAVVTAGGVWLAAPALVTWAWWVVALVIAGAAVAGKAAGLMLARYRLRRAFDMLERSL